MLNKKEVDLIELWLKAPYPHHIIKRILHLRENAPHALGEAFAGTLRFGTGGLRGRMDIGTNNINEITIAAATAALADFLKNKYGADQPLKVAIAFDSRRNSKTFAEMAAAVLSCHKIHCYIFEDARPTPLLSFAVRRRSCCAGIVITASHNPKEDNGYKVYGEDGAQITAPADTYIQEAMDRLLKTALPLPSPHQEYCHTLRLEEDYYEMVEEMFPPQEDDGDYRKEIRIVYTPLHGTGIKIIYPLLRRMGFHSISVVEKQQEPDGDFPSIDFPNPEDKNALALAVAQAIEEDADILLATDPDADRIALGIKEKKGEYILLNGNQSAALLFDFVLGNFFADRGRAQNAREPYAMKTIVTSELLQRISKYYNIPCLNTLTGFKWIARHIRENEERAQFLIGAEESLGVLIGDKVRDKDGAIGAAAICEMIAQAKQKGISPLALLQNLYRKYGFFYDGQYALNKTGSAGKAAIQQVMDTLRHRPPQAIADTAVVCVLDYLHGKQYNREVNTEEKIPLPSSNVLQYQLQDHTLISIRPSGTEPKLKLYCSVFEPHYSRYKSYKDAVAAAEKKITYYLQALQRNISFS